jgi:M6 family metalloprotease-like protein
LKRTVVFLVFAAATLFASSGVVLAQSASPARTTPDSSDQSSAQKSSDHQQGSKVRKSGIFAYRTGGETPDGDHEHQVEYFIVDAQGKETKLQLTDEAVLREALKEQGVSRKQLEDGGPQPLVGKRVTIEGNWTSRDVKGERPSDDDKIKVEKIGTAPAGNEQSQFDFQANPAVTGSKPAITIACKYADNAAEPKTISYFDSLVSGTTQPGLDHFWRETSYDQINLAGSQVVGWYTLPRARAEYLDPFGNADLGLLARDCTALADGSVFFPGYSTINLVFNAELDGAAWGGSQPLTLDGRTITYGATWMPPWGYENQGILAHEMGHSYGLPHSSGPYGQTYDSWWDVMSSGGYLFQHLGPLFDDCFRDPTYGCMAMGTISAHKDKLGWIPSRQRYTAAANSQRTLTIDRLSTAVSISGNYLMARIPIDGSSTKFYTVEARRPVGYDAHAAADGLVLHKIDTSQAVDLTRFAYVVDADTDPFNLNPNDDTATWTPGETFTDLANDIEVQVLGSTASGYTVSIRNGLGTLITASPPEFSNSNSGTFSFDDQREGAGVAGFECKLDGGSFVACTSPQSYSGLSDGGHTFQVRAIDLAGNPVDQSPTVYQWTIDTIAPTVSLFQIVNGSNGWNKTSPVRVFADAFDPGTLSPVPTCKDGNIPLSVRFGEVSISGEGIHNVSCSFTDKAGHTTTASDTVKIDTRAPIISNQGAGLETQPNAAGWYKTDVTNGFQVSDFNVIVFSSNSGLNDACRAAFPVFSDLFSGLQFKTTSGEGSALKVTSDNCIDVAGNTAAAKDSATFKVDKTSPTISDLGPTTQPNQAGWYTTDVTNRFQAGDSLSGLNAACVTAFPADQAGDNIQSRTTSGEGPAVKVTSDSCTDLAGNTAAANDSATFKIDKSNPSVAETIPPAGATGVSRSTKVTATFSEEVQAATLTSTTLFSGNSTKPIKATLSTTPTSVTLTPSSKLDAKTRYTAKIEGGQNGVKDLAGHALGSDFSWSFTTGSQ